MIRTALLALVLLAAVAATAEAAPGGKVLGGDVVCADGWDGACRLPSLSTTTSSCKVTNDGTVQCQTDDSTSG